jgi:hypothetical protein
MYRYSRSFTDAYVGPYLNQEIFIEKASAEKKILVVISSKAPYLSYLTSVSAVVVASQRSSIGVTTYFRWLRQKFLLQSRSC